VTRFLYNESCNQCSACKTELGIASAAIDAMFGPGVAAPDLLERAVLAAHRAPQGNRCALPAEGAAFVSSVATSFRGDFLSRMAAADPTDTEYRLPVIVDYDELEHSFSYARTAR
jgi:NADH:ubiquinone oxidoreductase subunit F (NADH-binding)